MYSGVEQEDDAKDKAWSDALKLHERPVHLVARRHKVAPLPHGRRAVGFVPPTRTACLLILERKVAMKRPIMLITLLLPVLAGCVSYVTPLGPTNLTITDAKQGQDCRRQFGIGGIPDVTGTRAMRLGGITKLRSTEYRVNSFSGVGKECVIAHGE